MPFIFCILVGMVILAFMIWKKTDIKTQRKKILQLVVCTVTWVCLSYQLVSIAHYSDESGEKIRNIMGNYGLELLWISIISFSIYLFYLYIDYFLKKKQLK